MHPSSYFIKHKQQALLKQSKVRVSKPESVVNVNVSQSSKSISVNNSHSNGSGSPNKDITTRRGQQIIGSDFGELPNDRQVQESVLRRHRSGQQTDGNETDLSFEDKTEEQKVYEEYKMIKKKYQEELLEINQ